MQKNEEKYCPIKFLRPNATASSVQCWGPRCALWVSNPEADNDYDNEPYKKISTGWCALRGQQHD